MRNLGYMIVGFEFGSVWGDLFAKHQAGMTGHEWIVRLGLAFFVWTVLVFA